MSAGSGRRKSSPGLYGDVTVSGVYLIDSVLLEMIIFAADHSLVQLLHLQLCRVSGLDLTKLHLTQDLELISTWKLALACL